MSSFGTLFIFQYLEMGLLSKWSYESKGPLQTGNSKSATNGKPNEQISALKSPGTSLDRLRFGLHSTISFRDVDTSHEVKKVPHFSSQDPSYIPSRNRFLVFAITRCFVCYMILDLLESQPPPPNTAQFFAKESIPFFTRLHQVTVEEIVTRFFLSITFWVFLYCMLNCTSSAIFGFCVASGLSEVRVCRPLMGSFSEVYTIRGLWGYDVPDIILLK